MMKVSCCILAAALLCVTSASLVKRQASPSGPTTPMRTPPPPSMPPTTPDVPPSPSGGSSMPPNTGAPTTTGPGHPNCLDKRDDCITFNSDGCTGIYASWAKANCPRYCGYCIHPNDTMMECKDNIPNCNEYQNDTCTNPKFRIFATTKCQKYCNLCDAGPKPILPGSGTTVSSLDPTLRNVSTTGTPDCHDTVDICWNEPDENCFGIYEAWAKGHCPFRCGFCPEKPKCEDEINICQQFGSSSCTGNYAGWARKNCRKTCNLCALPVRPSSSGVTSNPGTISGSPDPGNPAMVPTTPVPSPGGAASNSNATTTPVHGIFGPGLTGADVVGNKATYIIQGIPSSTPGYCQYKGDLHPKGINWYDGCDYVCNCFDAAQNRIICTERCINWGTLPPTLSGCVLVQEPECCERLECRV